MKTNQLALVVVICLQYGCSSPARTEQVQSAVQSSSTVSPIGAAAYQHTLEHSKFTLGSGAAARDEFGMHKIVGDQGVFATRISGMVTALANANASVRQGTPISDDKTHNDAVRTYFVNAGLPADQIDSVQDFEVVNAPASSESSAGVQRTVAYRYSMIKRQIQGVPVPDSFAWARMNTDGSVVEEQVYWPAITQDVIDRALALSVRLADPTTLATFEGQLPAHEKYKGLAIHHSPGEWDHAFVAEAFYDVLEKKSSMPAVLHANQAGTITTLPYEAPGAWGPEVGTPRKGL